MAALPDLADSFRESYGVKEFLRDMTGGAAMNVAQVFEPTCTICGLDAGYQGEGSKTVLPARAAAKVDFRLVPDQTPEEAHRLLRAHLDAEGFGDISIRVHGGEAPGRTDPDHPFLRLVAETAKPVYGVAMQIVPMIGGSGPNHAFIEELGVPVATAGFGHPDTRAHAPDENLRVSYYVQHAKHVARLLSAFAERGA
jgi:acetylornithine deacetylase/succinyl-diaminopimelate desuccinylase-like protein